MKKIIKNFALTFIVLSMFVPFQLFSQESMTLCTIHIPTICPHNGSVWAVHQDLGISEVQSWSTLDNTYLAHIAWPDPLPGIAPATYYAQTPRVAYNQQYDLECVGENTVLIGYNYNLEVDVYLETYFYEDGVLVEDPPLSD